VLVCACVLVLEYGVCKQAAHVHQVCCCAYVCVCMCACVRLCSRA